MDEGLTDTLPRRPLWPVLTVIGLVLGGLGFFGWRLVTAPDERKVLVVVDLGGRWWEGSIGAAALADSLSDRFESMGFLVVRGGDPEVTEILETLRDPREAAAKLRAAWVVQTELALKETALPIDGGYFELRGEGPVVVFHTDGPVTTSPTVSGWAGSKQSDEAHRLLGEALADRVFDAALPLLVEHPSLRDIFHAGAASPDSVLADKLRLAREYVQAREKTLKEAQDLYADVARRREQGEQGPVPVRFHSDIAANDGLCGMGPDGALVKTEDSPLFFLPEKRSLGRLSALESLVWMAPDGTRRPLWTGYNLYSYPVLGADRTSAVVVEDLFGRAKTVTLVSPDGQAKRLRVDPTHRYSSGRLAPGGRLVAIQDRDCRDCPESVLVIDATDATEAHRLAPGGGAFGGWFWLDATHLAVLHTPGQEEPSADALFHNRGPQTTLYSVELGDGAPRVTPLWQPAPDERLSWLAGTPDARRLAFEINRPGDDHIGVYDLATHEVFRLAPGPCSSPSLSPDGKAVTFQWVDESGGDEEVGAMVIGTDTPRRLTDNRMRDRYPQFDHTGTRIYFESLADDPNFKGRRMVSRIASVPFEPGAR